MFTITNTPIMNSLHRSRRGSILVLVIVLLVLLALMGMAYLATTRADRSSSDQARANANNSLSVDGVLQMVLARIADVSQRQASPPIEPMADYRNGLYLAARYPKALGTPATIVAWPSISMPLTFTGTGITGASFVIPATGAAAVTFAPAAGVYKDTYYFQPGPSTLTLRNALGQAINATGAPGAVIIPAADTDGDGIADAGFFRLSGVSSDRLTYYAAVRIIDNNSAINVNTAWSQADYDMSGNVIANQGLFLTSTGLHELYDLYDGGISTPFGAWSGAGRQSQRLHLLHTGQAAWGTDGTSLQNGIFGQTLALACVYDDSGNRREMPPAGSNMPDFQFVSQGDALASQLGRRLDFPGANGSAAVYKELPFSDQLQLSYPFAIRPATVSRSLTELTLTESLWDTAPRAPYSGTSQMAWYTQNFDWDTVGAQPRSIRSYLVNRNPVSNTVVAPTPATGMPPWPANPVKANVNTAPFEELWRAFWSVMVNPTAPATPRPRTPAAAGMFQRNIERQGGAPTVTLSDMTLIRSALAAANTVALREGNDPIASDNVPVLSVPISGGRFCVAYGMKRQPFITQCVVQLETSAAPNNRFIAIELFNPTTATISFANYSIGVLNRATSGNLLVTPIPTPAGLATIAPGQHVVIYEGSYTTDGAGTVAATIPAGWILMPGLAAAIAPTNEIILQRTSATTGARAFATPVVAPNTSVAVDETTRQADWVPLDMIDLRNVAAPSGTSTKVRYDYERPCPGIGDWSCAFAGAYATATPANPFSLISQTAADNLVDTNGAVANLGNPKAAHVPAGPGAFAVEVNPFGHVGPNPWQGVANPPTYRFPFGAFARNGDILAVPYVGNYRIVDAASQTIEVNSVALDAALAYDATAGGGQMVGRFWPLLPASSTLDGAYEWAHHLFEYLTVQSPEDDYLPNVIPGVLPRSTYYNPQYPVAPQAVQNSPITTPPNPNGPNDSRVGVNGLININTAPWKVISMLPLVVDATGQVDNAGPAFNNDNMAKAIVAYREANGPYQSLFDLRLIPANYGGFTNPAFSSPAGLADTAPYGELMPAGGHAAFRTAALQLTRISNLVTTRSDSFTVYILVQAWRNTGPATFVFDSEHRAAFYVNRCNDLGVNPGASPTQRVVPIPIR